MTHPIPPDSPHGQTYSSVCPPRRPGAKLVDFGGWDMPLHYGSQLDEHHRVRHVAGVFDVSHMTVVDFADPDPTCALLRHLLANDVARLYPGKALYTCMLNEAGGVIDDLIVYDRAKLVTDWC